MYKGSKMAAIGLILGTILVGCGGNAAGDSTEGSLGQNTEFIGEESDGQDAAQKEAGISGQGNSQADKLNTSDSQVTFTDDLGQTVTITSPEKVAVLSGSLADAWILAGGELAAATEDAWELEGLSLDENVQSVGSLTAPDLETLIVGEIDFAILSSNLSDQVALRDSFEAAGIQTAYFEVETFSDYAAMMEIFTDITGRTDLYQSNVAEIQETIDEQIARNSGTNPTVLFLRSYASGVKAKGSDSMTGAMLKDLGCINIADSDSTFTENLSMEVIVAADPDYIFVTTMGSSQEAAMETMEEMFTTNPAWSSLTAVQEGNYHVLPKELFQNKPNNRWGESYCQLADILYGEFYENTQK